MDLNFHSFLKQPDIVLTTTPDMDSLESSILQRSRTGKTIQVMYGETYDRFGPTLDSLKYYFFVAGVGKLLRQRQIQVKPAILIADIAACRNEPEDQHELLMRIGQQRACFVSALSTIYGLELTVILMSDYLHTDQFQSRLAHIRNEAQKHNELEQWVRQTVPPSKVDIEASKGFAYAFEEIATIVDYDIKVGPPREKFYDEPARLISQSLGYLPLQSIYLHPTYPLGLGRDFFFANEEIEQYGVTPYKAGSKNLAQQRIILGQTSEDELNSLIQKTFVSKRSSIPNPVLDTLIIAQMARQWLTRQLEPVTIAESFYAGEISVESLKQRVLSELKEYVITPTHPLFEEGEPAPQFISSQSVG